MRHDPRMAIISVSTISIAFGGQPLLEGVDFQLESRDRACLVGRNGEGKSTLLRLLNREIEPDEGSIVFGEGITTAYLPQHVPPDIHGTVCGIVAAGVPEKMARDEANAGPRQVERVLSLVKLDGNATFESLSGGLKRRTLLARALVANPDVLLLDEPTNHLDIDAIEWLEGFLKRYAGTLLFVTHDRMFLRRLATRIVDLDRGKLVHWPCDYDTFLRRKQDILDDETVQNRRFDRKLSKEEIWIRQGIKARRTRNEGRVRALEEMRGMRQARRTVVGTAKIQLQEAERSGQVVIKAHHVTFGYHGNPVVKDLTTTIMRGDKVGFIGPNGCGKTTLLRLLLGPHAATKEEKAAGKSRDVLDHRTFTFELTDTRTLGLQPQSGTIKHGTRIEVAYFDQHRHTLDEHASVFANVGRGSESVVINGHPRNVYGYLQDFLFAPDRARTPVSALSGGERNRLLLAKLFTQPANLLVMDEPTNDLDAETLALLEEKLVEYSGTLLLVSHDREFLNNVVTSTVVFEGAGMFREYVGGYDDWLRQRPRPIPSEPATRRASTRPRPPQPRRLTYKENRELLGLPAKIEALDAEQEKLHAFLADPSTYREAGPEIAGAVERVKEVEETLKGIYARWEALEAIKEGRFGVGD